MFRRLQRALPHRQKSYPISSVSDLRWEIDPSPTHSRRTSDDAPSLSPSISHTRSEDPDSSASPASREAWKDLRILYAAGEGDDSDSFRSGVDRLVLRAIKRQSRLLRATSTSSTSASSASVSHPTRSEEESDDRHFTHIELSRGRSPWEVYGLSRGDSDATPPPPYSAFPQGSEDSQVADEMFNQRTTATSSPSAVDTASTRHRGDSENEQPNSFFHSDISELADTSFTPQEDKSRVSFPHTAASELDAIDTARERAVYINPSPPQSSISHRGHTRRRPFSARLAAAFSPFASRSSVVDDESSHSYPRTGTAHSPQSFPSASEHSINSCFIPDQSQSRAYRRYLPDASSASANRFTHPAHQPFPFCSPPYRPGIWAEPSKATDDDNDDNQDIDATSSSSDIDIGSASTRSTAKTVSFADPIASDFDPTASPDDAETESVDLDTYSLDSLESDGPPDPDFLSALSALSDSSDVDAESLFGADALSEESDEDRLPRSPLVFRVSEESESWPVSITITTSSTCSVIDAINAIASTISSLAEGARAYRHIARSLSLSLNPRDDQRRHSSPTSVYDEDEAENVYNDDIDDVDDEYNDDIKGDCGAVDLGYLSDMASSLADNLRSLSSFSSDGTESADDEDEELM